MTSFEYIYSPGKYSNIYTSEHTDLYHYSVYVGAQEITTRITNSYWYLYDNKAICKSGDASVIKSPVLCIEIVGYTSEDRTSTYSRGTDLPYINGCSTKQLIPPVRPGDPTFQMLNIPPYTKEQAHHIHSTVRVVYVLSGKGKAVFDKNPNLDIQDTDLDLEPGGVIIINKMIPHHFETTSEPLVVLPMHIFSSTGSEHNHPMFNGTHKTRDIHE